MQIAFDDRCLNPIRAKVDAGTLLENDSRIAEEFDARNGYRPSPA